MTGSALFWLGITAACVAGLGISLVQLRKQQIERDALQQEVAAQRTAASLATERAEAAEAERTQLLEDYSTLKATAERPKPQRWQSRDTPRIADEMGRGVPRRPAYRA